ncbi:MAG: F0F1 ATP synthase subunit epsilon [Gammaproteobacteria bacterium]|jgi:F-type H+-transporting ATPase subunit epsilon
MAEETKTVQFDIVSAEESIFSGKVTMIVVSGEDGELGIMPGHMQLLTTIKPGQIRFTDANGKEEYFYISGGFLEVQPDVVTILADTVIRADNIDRERAEEAKKKAEQILASKKLDDYTIALIELNKALAQIRVADRWGKKQ